MLQSPKEVTDFSSQGHWQLLANELAEFAEAAKVAQVLMFGSTDARLLSPSYPRYAYAAL